MESHSPSEPVEDLRLERDAENADFRAARDHKSSAPVTLQISARSLRRKTEYPKNDFASS